VAALEQVCGLRGVGSRGQVTRTSVMPSRTIARSCDCCGGRLMTLRHRQQDAVRPPQATRQLRGGQRSLRLELKINRRRGDQCAIKSRRAEVPEPTFQDIHRSSIAKAWSASTG
jgi:hypothetical protein